MQPSVFCVVASCSLIIVKTGQHGAQLALLVQNLELRVLKKIYWSALVLIFISKLTVAPKDLLLDIFCKVFVCKC